jgi:hypothetical protein
VLEEPWVDAPVCFFAWVYDCFLFGARSYSVRSAPPVLICARKEPRYLHMSDVLPVIDGTIAISITDPIKNDQGKMLAS